MIVMQMGWVRGCLVDVARTSQTTRLSLFTVIIKPPLLYYR